VPDVVYGSGRGVATHDLRELNAFNAVFGGAAPRFVCLNGQLGTAEASSSLFLAAGALLSLKLGEIDPSLHCAAGAAQLPVVQALTSAPVERALVVASSECGNSAAVLFSKVGD
jgi:hypothetical protein